MINLYNQDCMIALEKMQDNEYDLAIVDPPYGIKDRMQGSKRFGQQSKNTDWNLNIPDKFYFDELLRVSKNQIIFGANYYANYLPHERDWIVWDKMQGDLNFSMHELAWTSFDKVPKILRHSTIRGKNKNRIHPCQKPVKLYEDLLFRYATKNCKILDTHLGSGSIAIACYNLNMNLDAYEIDKKHYDDALKRFKDYTKQLKIDV